MKEQLYCWECGCPVPGPHAPDCEHGKVIARLGATPTRRKSTAARLRDAEERLAWYAERRNYAPAGGESAYDAIAARDGYDGHGPGARARAYFADAEDETP